jgi:hypothetical protein
VASIIRAVGFVVLALAGVALFASLTVARSAEDARAATRDYRSLIRQALSDSEANNLRAEGAPQQAVVNGWVARDLLTIVAQQNADQIEADLILIEQNERLYAFLLLVVLGVAWGGLTRPSRSFATAPALVEAPVRAAPRPGAGGGGLAEVPHSSSSSPLVHPVSNTAAPPVREGWAVEGRTEAEVQQKVAEHARMMSSRGFQLESQELLITPDGYEARLRYVQDRSQEIDRR